ncbi:TetR/AcrR family transcriptional regulator [Saccharomonospora xinjiangensis]|uniref:TetR/AcrR family transcriptional regulator n=1 Tax=Saccharomonospora xinjiangensis TaxID=75294 RepID=UPI00106FD690|nr:TetR/AcrR family transcriptional regulator [Saccharomonospora xinjiangensis]QBQ60053.1 DNA-binding transcriptional repressor AcrR [Saccharomonospora xinjiangensis]
MVRTKYRQLSTAEERRHVVLETAVRAFAERGYFGTTTANVAEQAGISQAYVYRLFPDKETLFVEVVEHCFARIRQSFADGAAAARGDSPDAVLGAMGEAYARLITDRDLLLLHMHAQCAGVAVPVILDAVRRGYAGLVEYVRGVSGASDSLVRDFFARGMLCHLVVATGATQLDADWARTLTAGIRHY